MKVIEREAGSATPDLTIVTVVKDDIDGFKRTLCSIECQDAEKTEWVVVDSSNDQSTIQSLVENASHPCVSYLWTEPEGVYAAMNTGLKAVSGRYVHFLNAGDEFAAPSVVASLVETLATSDPIWLYGQVAFVSEVGRTVIPPPFNYQKEKRACFSRGRFPPHQGVVVKTSTLVGLGGFEENYRIAADYAVFLRLSSISDPLEMEELIARFFEGGLSSRRWRRALVEFHQARRVILSPAGFAAVREVLETTLLFVQIGSARLLRRLRR